MGDGVGVVGIEGEGSFIELDGERFVAGVHVGFGKAVVSVGGLRVKVDIEFEDEDGVGRAFLPEEAIAERVDGGFGDGTGLEGRIELLHGGIDAGFAHGFGETKTVGVVSIIFDPGKSERGDASGVAENGGSNGQAVFAVGEHHGG